MAPLSQVIDHDVAASLVRSDEGFNLYMKHSRPVSVNVRDFIVRRSDHGPHFAGLFSQPNPARGKARYQDNFGPPPRISGRRFWIPWVHPFWCRLLSGRIKGWPACLWWGRKRIITIQRKISNSSMAWPIRPPRPSTAWSSVWMKRKPSWWASSKTCPTA